MSIPFQFPLVLDPCWTFTDALASNRIGACASPNQLPRSVHIFPSGLKIKTCSQWSKHSEPKHKTTITDQLAGNRDFQRKRKTGNTASQKIELQIANVYAGLKGVWS
jgi:hypothetical protein